MSADTQRPPDDSPEASADRPTVVERSNVAPFNLRPGETCIVVQRHEEYDRDRDSEHLGSLLPEAEEREWVQAYDFFQKLLEDTPPDERQNVRIFFSASDSDFEGEPGSGERSYETAVIAQQAAEAAFTDYGLPLHRITNTQQDVRGGYPEINRQLREPQIFTDSPKFVAFLRREYPDDFRGMMTAYEDDRHAAVRKEEGAEGPNELADRLAGSIDALAEHARQLHTAYPHSRVVMWAVSHYDTISPYVKRNVLKTGIESHLPVEYGGGFTIGIDNDGSRNVRLAGRTYPLENTNPEEAAPPPQPLS